MAALIAKGGRLELRAGYGDMTCHLALWGVPGEDYGLACCVLESDRGDAATGKTEAQGHASRRNAQKGRGEEHNAQLLRTYQQQLKELSCIYGLAESLRTRESVEEICQDLVRLIPPAWRYPEYARARILMDGREHVSQPFTETKWGQSSAIVVNGRARGMVQVYYTREVWKDAEDGPFLPAERKLLDAVARTLGEAIERREYEMDSRRKAVILAQERNRLETILRGIGEGVVVTDTNDMVLMMNPAAQGLLGVTDREPIATNFLSLLSDPDFCEMWRKSAAIGEDFAKKDMRVGDPPSRTLWVTRSRIPELVQGEDCYVTILHDVTREREIDQMKTDFVSAVSHELRTPMTSIKGFVRTLLRDPNMPVHLREHFLGIIDEEAERLTQLIEALLEMGTIEAGRVVIERAPVDIVQTISHVVSSLTPAILGKQLEFVRDVPEDLPKPLGDSKRVYTIIINLMENAIKFTPKGGRITLSARADGRELVLIVRDSGEGIAKEHLERIFERFYQVRGGSHKAPGAGLGLFLVKEMVTLHGGTVGVESEPGKGAAFTVRLPLGNSEGDNGGI